MSSFKKMAGILVMAALVATGGTPVNATLINYWKCDDGSGGTLTNSGTAGSADNGVLLQATWGTSPKAPTVVSGAWEGAWGTGMFGGALVMSGNSATNSGRFTTSDAWSTGRTQTAQVATGSAGLNNSRNTGATVSMWVKWDGSQYPDLNRENYNYRGEYGAVFGRQMAGVGTNMIIGLNADGSPTIPANSYGNSTSDPNNAVGLRFLPSGGGNVVPLGNTATYTTGFPGNSGSFAMGTTSPGIGWNNIIVTITPGTSNVTYTMYLNGAQLGSALTGQSPQLNQSSGFPLTIGACYYWTTSYGGVGALGPFNGSIDDVGIFPGVLSAGQLRAIYTAPTVFSTPPGNNLYSLGTMDALFDTYASKDSLTGTTVGTLVWKYDYGFSVSGHSLGDTWFDSNTGYYHMWLGNNGPGGAPDGLTVIPEPSMLALLVMGLVGLLCYAWRKQQLAVSAAVFVVHFAVIVAPLSAGSISYVAIPETDSEAQSGISSGNTYTIAGNPGEGNYGEVYIGGVPFATMLPEEGYPNTVTWTINGHNYTYSIGNGNALLRGYTWDYGMPLDSEPLRYLLEDILYSEISVPNGTYTLTIPASSLTTGWIYDFRLYNRRWWYASRPITLYFDEDGVGPLGASTGEFDQDDATTVGFESADQVYYISYCYVASGQDLVITATNSSTSGFHLYGFTNQFVAVPEPSTLALLAGGLVGLLCYAWRKRR